MSASEPPKVPIAERAAPNTTTSRLLMLALLAVAPMLDSAVDRRTRAYTWATSEFCSEAFNHALPSRHRPARRHGAARLRAGADASHRPGGSEDPGDQRLPRQPAATARRHPHPRSAGRQQDGQRRRRRRRASGQRAQRVAREESEPHLRRRRRPGRRQPAGLGAVPRRADGRGARPDGPGGQCGGQPRVRPRQRRAAAAATRRLPPHRRLQGAAAVRRREVPLAGRQHHRHAQRPDAAAGLSRQALPGHPGGLHRPDA